MPESTTLSANATPTIRIALLGKPSPARESTSHLIRSALEDSCVEIIEAVDFAEMGDYEPSLSIVICTTPEDATALTLDAVKRHETVVLLVHQAKLSNNTDDNHPIQVTIPPLLSSLLAQTRGLPDACGVLLARAKTELAALTGKRPTPGAR